MGWLSKIGASIVGGTAGTLVDKVSSAVDRFVETPDEKRAFNALLSKAQTDINLIEAQHRSLFVAGWRPFIGWVCGFGLAWQFIFQHIIAWAVAISGKAIILPSLPTEGLLPLTLALLGVGGMRMFEKIKGVAK